MSKKQRKKINRLKQALQRQGEYHKFFEETKSRLDALEDLYLRIQKSPAPEPEEEEERFDARRYMPQSVMKVGTRVRLKHIFVPDLTDGCGPRAARPGMEGSVIMGYPGVSDISVIFDDRPGGLFYVPEQYLEVLEEANEKSPAPQPEREETATEAGQ